MRFEFISVASLPRLAWCAHLHRGRDSVDLYHGPWVETGANWFVEGAWTGAFVEGQCHTARFMAGTGGIAEGSQVIFVSPTMLCDRLYSLEKGDALYCSNSLPFVLEASGDDLDPTYLDYAADRRRQQAIGLLHVDKRLRIANGRSVRIHDYCNIAVTPDLIIRRIEKSPMPAPRDYADYRRALESTIAEVQANAADPARTHCRYRPVATVSRGYDGNALAALMVRHGAREAIAFTDNPEDDGSAVAERMGYAVSRYRTRAYRDLPNVPEAEFHATPWGADIVMLGCERQLEGALLVTGRRGDTLLKTLQPAAPLLSVRGYNALSGAMMGEFRLRVGFLHFAPFFTAALHPEAIHRITTSAEMKPWVIGGTYDRPIARRFIEEAGIPRDWFGIRKLATAHFQITKPDQMTPAGAADFTSFLKTLPPIPIRRRVAHNSRRVFFRLALFMNQVRKKTLRAFGKQIRQVPFSTSDRVTALTRNSTIDMSRLFHWGVARVRRRYALHGS